MAEEKDIFEKEVEEEEKKCIAKTSSGKSCNNIAVWPEDDPKACHIESHQNQVKAVEEAENELEEVEPEVIKKSDKSDGHIFSSKRADHKLIINTNKRNITVRFEKGVYKTMDDLEAKLIEEYVDSKPNLKKVITKVQ